MRRAGVLLVAVLLTGCGTTPDGPATDASAQLACRDYMTSVLRDARDGLLTKAEFRAGVQEVHNQRARHASDEAVRDASERLLRALTSDDDPAGRIAVEDLAQACLDGGYLSD